MSYEYTDVYNLKNVLESVINFMEIAEEMEEGKLSGEDKKEYVMFRIKNKLGELSQNYQYEIETIIETTIFLSRLKRKININDISKNCSGCFKFL
jgi:hypothetical protein